MSSFPLVPLGELLTSAPDPHGVDPDGEYPIAGIYGFGRGMIQRAAVAGREMAATQLFRIRAGQFIYSRLKSFEGAYAIVSPEVDGYFVSNEFPTFDLDREQLEPGFLGLVLQAGPSLAAASLGREGDRRSPREAASQASPRSRHPPSSDRAATSDHRETRRRGVATQDDASGHRCRAHGTQRNNGGSFSEGDRRRPARRDDGHCAARAATDCSRSRRQLPGTWRAVIRQRGRSESQHSQALRSATNGFSKFTRAICSSILSLLGRVRSRWRAPPIMAA